MMALGRTLSEGQVRALVDEFYTASHEDIVGLFSIAKEVFELIGDEEAARKQTLRVVKAMLAAGMVAGDPPYHPGGYTPWANHDSNTILDRIRSEWLEMYRRPDIPDIVWFGPSQ